MSPACGTIWSRAMLSLCRRIKAKIRIEKRAMESWFMSAIILYASPHRHKRKQLDYKN